MTTSRSNVLPLRNGDGGGNGHSSYPPDLHHPLVLLCDDWERDLVAMERLLRRHGFRVVSVRTVKEAERALRQFQFSAVVADYRLGLGQPDGLALLAVAQQAQPHARRVLVTADPSGAALADLADATWCDKADEPAVALVKMLRAEG